MKKVTKRRESVRIKDKALANKIANILKWHNKRYLPENWEFHRSHYQWTTAYHTACYNKKISSEYLFPISLFGNIYLGRYLEALDWEDTPDSIISSKALYRSVIRAYKLYKQGKLT